MKMHKVKIISRTLGVPCFLKHFNFFFKMIFLMCSACTDISNFCPSGVFMLLYDSSGTIIVPNVSWIIPCPRTSAPKSVPKKQMNNRWTYSKTERGKEKQKKTVNIMSRAPLWTLAHKALSEMVGTTPAY